MQRRTVRRRIFAGILAGAFGLFLSTHARAQTIPSAPTNLVATSVSPFQINLSWADTSTNEDGFKVERSLDGTNFTQIAQLLPNTAIYRNTSLFPGATYYYRVRAFNAGGASGYTSVATASAQNPPCPLSFVGWGQNMDGETTPPADLTGPVAISSGFYQSVVLQSDGTVLGWGWGVWSVPPPGLSNVTAIAAGDNHALALLADSTVVGWGWNAYGEATPPAGLSNVVAIAAGGNQSLALKGDSTVVGWGYNDEGEATPPTGLSNVVAIAGGGYHSLALKSDGTVVGWGDNAQGQTTPPPGLTNVVAIEAGNFHSLALISDGTVVAWGDNYWGESTPPAGLTGVVAIAAGYLHSLALKGDGTVVSWGNNDAGAIISPAGMTGVVAIAGGFYRSLALTATPGLTYGLTAITVSSNEADLSWTGNSAEGAVFYIDRAPDFAGSPGTWAQIGTVGSGGTAYHDTSAVTNSTYWYRVHAGNACGNSPYSNLAAASIAPPAYPANLVTFALATNVVRLSWTDNSAGESGFYVERAPDVGGSPGTWSQIGVVGAGVTTFTNTVPIANAPYWYRVRAYNVLGTSYYSNQAVVNFIVASAPSNLAATLVSGNLVNLSWTDNSYNETGFIIDRAPDAPIHLIFATIGTVSSNTTTFSDYGVVTNRAYWYGIRAYNAFGTSDYSGTIRIYIPALPATPSALSATVVATNQINLLWSDNSTNETGFKVERALDNGGSPGTWSQITVVLSNLTTYSDTAVAANTRYWYRLRATNTSGDSPYSNLANASTASAPNAWVNPASDKWEIAPNWSQGVPAIAQSGILINNANTKTVTIDAATAASNSLNQCLTVAALTIAAPPGSANLLNLASSGLASPLHVVNTIAITSGGALNVTNAALQVDGTLGVDGAMTVQADGRLAVTNTAMYVGVVSTGQVTMTGGSAVLRTLMVASNAFATGTFNMAGGNLTYSNMWFGVGSNSSASVWLTGGTVTTTNRIFSIIAGRYGSAQLTVSNGATLNSWITWLGYGNSGIGTLNVAGGTANLGALNVANLSNAIAAAWVTGGQLLTTNQGLYVGGAAYTVGQLTISNATVRTGNSFAGSTLTIGGSQHSTGTLTISGGTLTSMGPTDTVIVANSDGSSGSVWINNGAVIATNTGGVLYLGLSGAGQLTLSNGAVTVGNFYGGILGGAGTLSVAAGTFSVLSNATVSGTGTVWLTGGQLLVTNGLFTLGTGSRAQMSVSGGVAVARNMAITPYNYANGTTLNLPGGKVTAFDSLVVGDCASNAVGQINVSGGTLYVTNASHTGYLDLRGGTLTISAGALVADVLVMTNSCGRFVHSGGSVSISSNVLASNLSAVGDGIPNGWKQQYGLDPLDSSLSNKDLDGTGFTVLQDYQAGLDPTNANSVLRITAIARASTDTHVYFTSVNGRYYALERCDWMGGPWTDIVTNIPGNSGIQWTKDVGGAFRTSVFYRISLAQSTNAPPADSDGDGIPDSWTQQYFGHPTGQSNDNSLTTLDPDGAGFTTLQDYLAGVDPTNPAAAFRITSVVQTGSDMLVTWTMGPNRTNALQATAGDARGGYNTNGFVDIFAITNTVGTVTNYLDSGAATNLPSRYYRVRIVP